MLQRKSVMLRARLMPMTAKIKGSTHATGIIPEFSGWHGV
jgi:hypothetical protein